jgi:WD40 repeat protein
VAKTVRPVLPRRGFASRLFGYDIFLSFALGPPPRGTHSYASDLARRLQECDFTVFFSEEEMPPGEQLDVALQRALLRSKALVVIANRDTLQEPRWVRKEVEEYRQRHPDRPVIPINVGGALQDPALNESAEEWLAYQGKVWIDESEEAVKTGIASERVVERLATTPRQSRANVRWRWVTGAVVALLSVLLVIAATAAWFADRNAKIAKLQAAKAFARQLAAQAELVMNQQPHLLQRSVLLAVESVNRFPTPEAAELVYAGLSLLPKRIQMIRTPGRVLDIAYSPDGRFLAAGDSTGHVNVWSLDSIQKVSSLNHGGWVDSIAFSRDGKLLATSASAGSGKSLRNRANSVLVWDIANETEVLLVEPGSPTLAVALSPDGRLLATGGHNGFARLWDVSEHRELLKMYHGTDNSVHFVKAVVFSPDGSLLATGGSDKQVHIWKVADSTELTRFNHEGRILSVNFSRSGEVFAAGSADGAVSLYETRSWSKLNVLQHELGPTERGVGSVVFSPDGQWLATATSRVVRLWEVYEGREAVRVANGDAVVDFHPNGDSFATGSGNIIQLWKATTGQAMARMQHERLKGVVTNPDGSILASFGGDGLVHLWDMETGFGRGLDVDGHPTDVSFHPNGSRVAILTDRQLAVWDVQSRTCVTQFNHSGGQANTGAVAFSADGQRLALVAIRYDRAAVWYGFVDLNNNKFQQAFPPFEDLDHSLSAHALSPDGRYLAVAVRNVRVIGAQEKIRVWGLTTAFNAVLPSKHRMTRFMAFSANGEFLAIGDPGLGVQVWNVAQKKMMAKIAFHGEMTAVALRHDGQWVIAGGSDGIVQVWKVTTGKEKARIRLTDPVRTLHISKDGRWLVTSTQDGTIQVWPLMTKDLIAEACSRLTRNLTSAEWLDYIGEEEYRANCDKLPVR